ncbi:MAG: DUF5309 family protein [Anaerovoracaceae bacterium]
MALAGNEALSSFDQGANREDLSDVLAMMIEKDLETTLNLIGGAKGAAKATKHEWPEGELDSMYAVLSSTPLAYNETSAVMDTGEGAKFRIGTLFRFDDGYDEVLQVTNISGDTLTVTRGYGSTSIPAGNASHAAAAGVIIISHPVQEDTDPINWEAIVRTVEYNYSHVYYKTTKVSDTQEAVDKAGVTSEISWQVENKLKEIMREMNVNTLLGIRSANAGSAAAYRSSGGIIEFVNAAGGNVIDAAGGETTETRLNNLLEDVYDDGGGQDGNLTLIVGPTQKRNISAIWKEYRRIGGSDTKVGGKVESFDSDFGTVDVLMERALKGLPDVILCVDKSRIAFMPLQGLPVSTRELPKTGRAHKREISGEYTLEVRNGLKAHGYMYGLAS